ncbi:hypothetical protein [Psychroserpens sp.]|uniref:hypothetical protein n=1 Tax=Psychroserpens sp. TaxID=2020870 RepID=UPI001B094B8C|nr:hypothetical protein [Psychroserpens sp.]MBO6605945.1 hypothetical protein [Psychroserpens sp.]MBO6630954.1 hypothetical protein [Psychroserpens sp.]MBO6652684.1 hypothetical protein [Psychroserpens sp.]MBO6681544.1 hypothetical protein [Psychroserpens sp.]MBO6749319.1 hypothetical protein [Psychroserpens sp.]
MRTLITLLLISILVSCKSEPKQPTSETDTKELQLEELTTAQKIANAHGYEQWKNVNRITFTFKVDRGGNSGNGRAWTWFPKKDSIQLNSDTNTVSYNRTEMDSTALNVDPAFINDKFWLLIPFQLIWDEGTTISESVKSNGPISNTEFNKITLTYSNEGGYTPGDAYDIYFDDKYIIREWTFRKGNAAEPTMSTTFENYQDYNGLLLARDHKMAQGDFNLNFQNVSVE